MQFREHLRGSERVGHESAARAQPQERKDKRKHGPHPPSSSHLIILCKLKTRLLLTSYDFLVYIFVFSEKFCYL